jgi:hypothetical protein
MTTTKTDFFALATKNLEATSLPNNHAPNV